jgi:hypothetical protein
MSDFCSRSLRALLLSSTIAAILAGCGGGGGSDAPSIPVKPTLTFTPTVATATVQAGRSATLNTDATVTTPADFANASSVYAFVIDTTGVIFPEVQISQTSSTSFRAVMQTVPTLAEGKHTGSFTVKVCRDRSCAQQFPGSPMQLPYDIAVLSPAAVPISVVPAASLAVTQHANTAPQAAIAVNVEAAGRTWTVSSASTWIKLSATSGSGNGSFNVSYDLAGLLAGTHSGEILVTGSNGQKITLPAQLQLLPSSFSIERGEIFINAINGAPMTDEAIKFNLVAGAATWSASASAPWFSVSPAGGPTPGITTLKVDPAMGKLASGTHTGVLTITAPNAITGNVPVTLNLTKATLSTSASTLTLGGPLGRDADQAALTMNLNTMGNAHPWTLSALPSWLGASASSGMVKQDGTSITFSQIMANLPYGTSVATLTASATVNGDTLTAPVTVTVNRDRHKLMFSEVGVGLSSTPSWSRLSRTVTVKDNFGLSPAWTASADQSWLTVTRSGAQLTLTANPAGLPVNTISYATVSLSSTDSTVETAEPLRVAIWNGSVTPSAQTQLNRTYLHLKTDPIRPLLYANNGASGIDVYNVYTAAQVATIANVGASLGQMAISPSGDRLYAYDTANRNIVVVDLRSMTKTASWPMAMSVDHDNALLAIRPNGVEVVLAADGNAYLASNGQIVGHPGIYGFAMAASRDGKRVYSIDTGTSPASAGAINVDYSAMAGGALSSARASGTAHGSIGSNGQDIAVSADGTRLYTAAGAPYRCSTLDTTDLTVVGMLPGGDAYPNNVEVASDGRVFCGIAGYYSEADVWVHSADGALLATFKFAGYAKNLLPQSMNVSADSMIMIGQTNDPRLVFVPVGP